MTTRVIMSKDNVLRLVLDEFRIAVEKTDQGWSGMLRIANSGVVASFRHACIASLLVDLANKGADHLREVMLHTVAHEFEQYIIENGLPEEFKK